MNKMLALIPAIIISSLATGCAVISSSATTDADLLVRAGKALNQNPESLKLRTRSTTTTSVTWQVEDISQTRYNCEYLSLGVVDDAGTTCKEIPKKWSFTCPEGFRKSPGFTVCEEISPIQLVNNKLQGHQRRMLYKEDLQRMGYWHEYYE